MQAYKDTLWSFTFLLHIVLVENTRAMIAGLVLLPCLIVAASHVLRWRAALS